MCSKILSFYHIEMFLISWTIRDGHWAQYNQTFSLKHNFKRRLDWYAISNDSYQF